MQTKQEIIQEVMDNINRINKQQDPEFLYANHNLSGPTAKWLNENPEMKELYIKVITAYLTDARKQ